MGDPDPTPDDAGPGPARWRPVRGGCAAGWRNAARKHTGMVVSRRGGQDSARSAGQDHLQAGGPGRAAVDGDATAVQFDDPLGDGQSESRSAVLDGA